MVHLKDIHFSFGGQTILKGISLHVKPGDRLGLVGPNGTGKTTLLRIIAGQIKGGVDGVIDRRRDVSIGLLPQDGIYVTGRSVIDAAMEPFAELIEMEREIDDLDEQIAACTDDADCDELVEKCGELRHRFESRGGFEIHAKTARVLTGLGFSEDEFERDTGTFSGGWQMRIALAKLLLSEPEILLLDEPTNHLDLPALEWFESFVNTYEGSIVLISHDRYFMDRTIHRIAELTRGNIELYNGNYSFYEDEKVKRIELLLNRIDNQQKEIRHHEQFIERFRYKAKKARQVQGRIKKLEKMEILEAPEKDRNLNFTFSASVKSGKTVMSLKDVGKSYGDNEVLKNVNLEILRGDRLAVIGANGLGKSTLMRILAGTSEFSGERAPGYNVTTGYFSQDQFELLSPDKTVLEEASLSCGPNFKGSVRSLLGIFLFSDDAVNKKTTVLSGGEKSRLLFAKLMAEPANFILLDEPTNHLDPQSQNMLIHVLNNFDGTLCFISHNRAFLNAVATRIIEFTRDGIEEYIGNYEDYLEQKRARRQAAEGDAGEGTGATEAKVSARKTARRERAKFVAERAKVLNPIKEKIEAVEKEIQQLEERAEEIETELADSATYDNAEKMKTLPAELKAANKRLTEAMSEWETLSEELSEAEELFKEED